MRDCIKNSSTSKGGSWLEPRVSIFSGHAVERGGAFMAHSGDIWLMCVVWTSLCVLYFMEFYM